MSLFIYAVLLLLGLVLLGLTVARVLLGGHQGAVGPYEDPALGPADSRREVRRG